MATPWDLFIATIGGVLGGGIVATTASKGVDWWQRPRLVVDVDRGAPWAAERYVREDSSSRTHRFLRARVRNVGRKSAPRCRVFMTEFSAPTDSRNLLDNPVPLIWAAEDGKEVELASGMEWFVNVLVIGENDSTPRPVVRDAVDSQINDLVNAHGTTNGRKPAFRLVAVAEGCQPAQLDCTYEQTSNWQSLEWVK